MKYINSIFIFLFICFICIIKANNDIDLNLNYKYYIISMKDASKYSFNIQPTKQNENVLNKRGKIPKFNAINIKDIHEIIKSKDCVSRLYNENVINDAETSLCNLGKSKNHFDNNKSGNKTISDKIDFEVLVKELEPEESFINKQYELLAELIIDNLDTYEKDDIITEDIHNMFRKRSKTTINDITSDIGFEKILKKTYNILDVTVFYGYLSDVVCDKIKNLPNVVECIEDLKMKQPTTAEYSKMNEEILFNNKKENKIYYNITDIKIDTQWSNVSVQQYAGSHLSLISQSKVDFNLVNRYDNNFYYPSTAGEGVDIYILDSGFNTNHVDFDTTYRNVTCDAEVRSSNIIEFEPSSPKSTNCTIDIEEQYHGIAVASAAAGTIYGVAKKANIHVIAFGLKTIEYITALKYIEKKAKDPHKTVINISSGGYTYYSTFDKQLNVLASKGFMIFASAGNDGIDACSTDIRYSKDFDEDVNDNHYPSGYIDVISVGGIDNNYKYILFNKFINIYRPACYSNYGSCVDIFAPSFAMLAYISDKKANEKQKGIKYEEGTSFSTPIVTGVAATLISEHPEITFNQDIMKQMLIDLSIKGAISDLDSLNTPNRLINIGKKVVYSTDNKYRGCGISSGKKNCPADNCCSAKGYCGNKAEHCEVDCQSKYGQCSMINYSTPHVSEKPKKESGFRDTLILNYYSDIDMCIKYVPSNDINKNIIMTVCKDMNIYNINNIWNIANEGDTKIIENYYEDICIHFDENGVVYANDCINGAVFKDIMTIHNNDSIQSDAFPGKCLKAVESDFDPYGITIFTDKHGVRVMMGDCDYSDNSQHWRFREVSKPFDGYDYFDDGPILDDYIDERSELSNYSDSEKEEEIIFDKYDQVVDLNEYLEYNKIKYPLNTNTKKVLIYNEELDLCVYSFGGYQAKVRLEECDEEDNGQLWYVPDNNKGYYVNVENNGISIIYTPMKELIYDEYLETIATSKKYVKNHSSVITYEDGFLKIYDKFNDEEVCIDVPEEQKSKKSRVFVNTVPCSETTTHWKLATEYSLA